MKKMEKYMMATKALHKLGGIKRIIFMKILTAIIITAIIIAVIVTGLTIGKQLQTKIIATHQQILNDIRQN